MLPNLFWLKLLKWGLPALFVAGVLWWSANTLIGIGEQNIQEKWDADVAKRTARENELKQKVAENERQYRRQLGIVENNLVVSESRYQRALADSRVAFSGELRKSEGRAELYRRMSEAGKTESANLAGYAAQLDRSLVEGRQMVEELRATVEQRDTQLRSIGEQLALDRQLIGVHQ